MKKLMLLSFVVTSVWCDGTKNPESSVPVVESQPSAPHTAWDSFFEYCESCRQISESLQVRAKRYDRTDLMCCSALVVTTGLVTFVRGRTGGFHKKMDTLLRETAAMKKALQDSKIKID